MKFNDEMLSLVLTAHENGGLCRMGKFKVLGYPGCLYQVALGIESFNDPLLDEAGWTPEHDGNVMDWFDANYNPNWTVEQFLQYLTNKGVV